MNKKIASGALVALMVFNIALYSAGRSSGAESGPGSSADPVVTKSYVDALFASVSPASHASFIVVEVEAGKKLYGGAGTEMILRSGSATALDNGSDGVSDLTAGKDIRQGAAIVSNHLLLVPRDDGRGIACKTKCWVMVKGDYEIK
jgi:hypothetical protein